MLERRNDFRARTASRLALFAGPALFVILLLLPRPEGLSSEGIATLAAAAWMAVWWLTVATPLEVTALLPLVLFPLLGVASPRSAAAPYANPVIFLFMGGFFIAAAMQRWSLHRRFALGIVSRTGTSPRRLIAGFMLATAALSMWMSNTAAVMMMMPIGVAILTVLKEPIGTESDAGDGGLGVALMLGIAYAGSIGGVATLIGTPPNAVLAGVASETLGFEVSFARWLSFGFPLALVMLVAAWVLLTFVLFPLPGRDAAGAAEALAAERAGQGPWHPAERVTAAVFVGAALAWIFREPKLIGSLAVPGIQSLAPAIGDATIAIAAALILFVWPTRDRDARSTTVLDWGHAASIPWGILVLFGGGLSLAGAFETSGLTTWLGGKLTVLAGLNTTLVIGAVAALFVFVTEVTSNTATATLGLPIVAALAPSVGVEPLVLMATAAAAASMAFMLPVATPPNAIVFGSGYIQARDMSRAGIWLNLFSIVAITAAISLLI